MDAGELVRRHGPLVRRLAARALPRVPGLPLDAEDLAQEAFLALPGAAAAFDPARGVALETYLALRLRGAMLDALRRADHLKRAQRARVSAGLEPPVLVGSLDAPADPRDPDSAAVLDLLPQTREPGPGDALEVRDLCDYLGRGLDPRRAGAFRLHLLGGLTLARAGREMGLSESCVSQLAADALDHCRDRAALLQAREGRTVSETTNGFAAAQRLHALLKNIGPGLTYEAARRHLGEDGQVVTREQYEAAWRSLHGGERGGASGRERLPPGSDRPAPPPEPEPQPEPQPEPEVTTVSEQNGVHVAPRSNIEKSSCLQALVREMGPEARHRDIKARAAELGLPASDAAVNRAQNAVFPDRPKRPGGPGLTKQAPAAEGDLLASVLDARRRLAALKQQVEAAGGSMTYKIAFTLEEEG